MELNQILLQIDSLKKEAEDLQPLKPNQERIFWDKFRLEFNYNSNHMEGNTLTYGHTQILLKSGDVVGKYNIRELQEMKAHDLALKIIRESSDDPEFHLSQKFIKEINQLILVEPFYNEAITQDGKPTQKLITPGEYKKTPNSVLLANGEMYFYPSPEETPALMSDLIDWYEKEKDAKELHPVQIAALFHYKIVRIHPFDDSNGRTARLMMNYILLKNGFAPLVIESKDKNLYLRALNEADAGNIEAFIIYVAHLSLNWQNLYRRALNGESIEEKEDFEKEVDILKRNFKNSKDGIKITFTTDALNNILKESILPLIISVNTYISKFDDFFIKKKNLFKAIGQGNCVAIEALPDFFSQILENSITTPFKCEFHYIHLQLRKESNLDFNYTTDIYFDFYDFGYEIRTGVSKTLSLKKHYHENLSKEEIDKFSKSLAKIELTIIQNLGM